MAKKSMHILYTGMDICWNRILVLLLLFIFLVSIIDQYPILCLSIMVRDIFFLFLKVYLALVGGILQRDSCIFVFIFLFWKGFEGFFFF